MTDLKTPYLDRVIEFLSDSTFINSDFFTAKLQEYQSIKEALKRLDDAAYLLKSALEILQDNDLQTVKNSDNWIVGSSIEELLKEIEV